MAVAAALNVNVAANTANFSKGMTRAKSELTDFQKSVNLAKAGLAAFGAGFTAAAAVSFLKDSINAFEEAYQQQQKLAAVLVATGHAAGFSKQQLNEYASAIQATTNYDDDAVAGAQAVLATFKEIKGARFTEATNAILDLSAVMGQDLQSSAVQVGKALNDPIRGMTALRRVGVSFTEQQVDMVKQMVAANDVVGAQKLILAELKSEFGGTAAAQRSELKGLANDWGDLKEAIGSFAQTDLATKVFGELSAAIRGASADISEFSKNLDVGFAGIEMFSTHQDAEDKLKHFFDFADAGLKKLGNDQANFAVGVFKGAILPDEQAQGAGSKAAGNSNRDVAAFRAEIEKEIESLDKEIAMLGKSAAEKRLMGFASKAAADGIGESAAASLADAQAKLKELEAAQKQDAIVRKIQASREAANESADRQIRQLEIEAKTWGMDGAAADDYRRDMDGVTEARRKYLAQLEKEAKHRGFLDRQTSRQDDFDKRNVQREGDKQQQMTDEFKALEDKFKTPQQKLDEQLASIQAKRDAGFGATASGRAVLDKAEAEARKNFADETAGPKRDRTQGNQALLANSSEAFSAIFRAPGGVGSRDSAEKTRKQQLAELRASRKAAEETAKALKNGQIVAVGAMPT